MILIFFVLVFSKQFTENYGQFDVFIKEEPTNTTQKENVCNLEQIKHQLNKIEEQIAEKSNSLRWEIHEENRLLHNLSQQNFEMGSTLQNLRQDLKVQCKDNNNFTKIFQCQASLGTLGRKIDNLSKGVQILITAMSSMYNDVGFIKRNLSSLTNSQSGHDDLTGKISFTSFLDEINHGLLQKYPPHKSKDTPQSCSELKRKHPSGIYSIQPPNSHNSFLVLCDMDTYGGGWTVIQSRFDGSQDFFLNWQDYKFGFGNLAGEFWLGLDKIHAITGSEVNELLIELIDFDLETKYAHYKFFSIGPETEGYRLKVLGGYSGTAGDSLMYHSGSKFSTKDMDRDVWDEGNCAKSHGGGWWYKGCDTCNLNGKYLNGQVADGNTYQGMYWKEFRGPQYSLMQARMLVRPRNIETPTQFSNIQSY